MISANVDDGADFRNVDTKTGNFQHNEQWKYSARIYSRATQIETRLTANYK